MCTWWSRRQRRGQRRTAGALSELYAGQAATARGARGRAKARWAAKGGAPCVRRRRDGRKTGVRRKERRKEELGVKGGGSLCVTMSWGRKED
ncbi:hypothetical protein LguiA_030154 [Lonicera macranthoides]